MTTAPGIFAAGDIAFGPRLIINAVADGKKTAVEIDKYLRGPEWKPKSRYVQVTVLDHHEMAAHYDEYSRLNVPVLPIDRRTGVAEVETGYTEAQARNEASRCLRCWINTIFEGTETTGTECILCGGCVDVCPENCLSLVPLKNFAFTDEDKERLRKEQETPLDRSSACRTGRTRSVGRFRDGQGRNHLHPLRPLRRALPRAHHFHGSLRGF